MQIEAPHTPRPLSQDPPPAQRSHARWHLPSVRRVTEDRNVPNILPESYSPPGLPSYILLPPHSLPEAPRPALLQAPRRSPGGAIRPDVSEVLRYGSYLTIFSLLNYSVSSILCLLCCVFVQSAQSLHRSSNLLQSSPYVRSCLHQFFPTALCCRFLSQSRSLPPL